MPGVRDPGGISTASALAELGVSILESVGTLSFIFSKLGGWLVSSLGGWLYKGKH
jgi:hypothetical protein